MNMYSVYTSFARQSRQTLRGPRRTHPPSAQHAPSHAQGSLLRRVHSRQQGKRSERGVEAEGRERGSRWPALHMLTNSFNTANNQGTASSEGVAWGGGTFLMGA
jgi:hypothetical protein